MIDKIAIGDTIKYTHSLLGELYVLNGVVEYVGSKALLVNCTSLSYCDDLHIVYFKDLL